MSTSSDNYNLKTLRARFLFVEARIVMLDLKALRPYKAGQENAFPDIVAKLVRGMAIVQHLDAFDCGGSVDAGVPMELALLCLRTSAALQNWWRPLDILRADCEGYSDPLGPVYGAEYEEEKKELEAVLHWRTDHPSDTPDLYNTIIHKDVTTDEFRCAFEKISPEVASKIKAQLTDLLVA